MLERGIAGTPAIAIGGGEGLMRARVRGVTRRGVEVAMGTRRKEPSQA